VQKRIAVQERARITAPFKPAQLKAAVVAQIAEKIRSIQPFWGKLPGFEQFDKALP
jgi:hypothetical protein